MEKKEDEPIPSRSKAPCRKPGCSSLVTTGEGYCELHKRKDTERPSSNDRGYNSKWRSARVGYLRKHPLCHHCEEEGRVTLATEVDHIRPHKGDKEIFWDSDNWQPLCKTHHSRKTAKESGFY